MAVFLGRASPALRKRVDTPTFGTLPNPRRLGQNRAICERRRATLCPTRVPVDLRPGLSLSSHSGETCGLPQRLTYRPFLSRKAEIGKERIQQVLPRRRTEIGPQAAAHSADLIQQASRNRERASPPSRACPSARCSTPGTTGSEACSSAKRAAWRGALPQEPREANPSGRPTTRETRSPEALFPR